MPIEVRELIIRATVDRDDGDSSRTESPRREPSGEGVNDCLTKMEEIRKMILEKNER